MEPRAETRWAARVAVAARVRVGTRGPPLPCFPPHVHMFKIFSQYNFFKSNSVEIKIRTDKVSFSLHGSPGGNQAHSVSVSMSMGAPTPDSPGFSPRPPYALLRVPAWRPPASKAQPEQQGPDPSSQFIGPLLTGLGGEEPPLLQHGDGTRRVRAPSSPGSGPGQSPTSLNSNLQPL